MDSDCTQKTIRFSCFELESKINVFCWMPSPNRLTVNVSQLHTHSDMLPPSFTSPHVSPFTQCSSRVSCSSGDKLTLALSTSASTSCPSNSPTSSKGTSPSFCETFHWRAVINSGRVSLTVFPSLTRQIHKVSFSAPATQVLLDYRETVGG